MRNLIGGGLVALVTVASAVPLVAAPLRAHHDRAQGNVVKVVSKHNRRHAVGYRFERNKVAILRDWKSRGLRKPDRNEAYILDAGNIYLVNITTLIVKR